MRVRTLSPAALSLFKRHVELGRTIDIDANLATYEKLADARLMVVGNSYAWGGKSIYTVTKEGFERKLDLFRSAKESA